jgi:deoxyribodipyrimidine photo-lyase
MDIAAPSRSAALARLAEFAPRMGAHYERGRNADPGPGARTDVARLSPHVRHRVLLESELVGTALALHGPQQAEKFIQEVFWRSYWKGYLQLRPQMWRGHQERVAREQAALATQGGLRRAVEQAMAGQTGIACFDAWAHELREEGWLHNHARMWFASIWIFTLRLPWPLGAAFFQAHLQDHDAASNTLSWRWVAGIQTPGKHYLARAENIARFTNGRFDPRGELNEAAEPLDEPGPPAPGTLETLAPVPSGPLALLLHEDDLHVDSLPDWQVARIAAIPGSSPFAEAALDDALMRAGARFNRPVGRIAVDDIAAWADGLPVAAPDLPVGPAADALAGQALFRWRRPWDAACWPLARKGFFQFRGAIPGLLRSLDPQAPSALQRG